VFFYYLYILHIYFICTFITDKCKQLSERYRHTIRFTRSPLPLLRGQVITEDTMNAGLHPSSSPQPLFLPRACRMRPCCFDLGRCLWGCWRRYAARRPSPACQYLREHSGGQYCMRYRVGAAMQCGWETYLCSRVGGATPSLEGSGRATGAPSPESKDRKTSKQLWGRLKR
jgi:hypothetical protein